MERHRKPIWRHLLLPGAAQSYTVISPPLCCYLKIEKKKKGCCFSQALATPYPRVPVEMEMFPMLSWPVSDTFITRSRLLGVMKEAMGGQDRIEADYFPLTFNSQFYSKYCWQDFWTFGNSV